MIQFKDAEGDSNSLHVKITAGVPKYLYFYISDTGPVVSLNRAQARYLRDQIDLRLDEIAEPSEDTLGAL